MVKILTDYVKIDWLNLANPYMYSAETTHPSPTIQTINNIFLFTKTMNYSQMSYFPIKINPTFFRLLFETKIIVQSMPSFSTKSAEKTKPQVFQPKITSFSHNLIWLWSIN